MPFTEKPTRMVTFDTNDDGRGFIEIQWTDGHKSKWIWDNDCKGWVHQKNA